MVADSERINIKQVEGKMERGRLWAKDIANGDEYLVSIGARGALLERTDDGKQIWVNLENRIAIVSYPDWLWYLRTDNNTPLSKLFAHIARARLQ